MWWLCHIRVFCLALKYVSLWLYGRKSAKASVHLLYKVNKYLFRRSLLKYPVTTYSQQPLQPFAFNIHIVNIFWTNLTKRIFKSIKSLSFKFLHEISILLIHAFSLLRAWFNFTSVWIMKKMSESARNECNKNQLKHLIRNKDSHILLLMKEDILQHRKSELTWYLCPLADFVLQ